MLEPIARKVVWPALLLALVLGWGCGPGTGEPATEEEIPEPAAEADDSARPDVEAQLALADASDGVVDHVVSRCPGCGLAMEGSQEQAVQWGGYEIRFCSAGCKESFEADPEAMLLALSIPDNPPQFDPAAEAESEQ